MFKTYALWKEQGRMFALSIFKREFRIYIFKSWSHGPYSWPVEFQVRSTDPIAKVWPRRK